MPVRASERDPACVLHVLTHQGVSTRVLQRLLDLRRLVTNHVDDQLGAAELTELLIGGFNLPGVRGGARGGSVRAHGRGGGLYLHPPLTYLQIVEGQEGLGFTTLLFDVLDAVASGLLRVYDDGVHVLPQNLGHSDLVLLLSGLAQIDESPVLQTDRNRLTFYNHLLLQ